MSVTFTNATLLSVTYSRSDKNADYTPNQIGQNAHLRSDDERVDGTFTFQISASYVEPEIAAKLTIAGSSEETRYNGDYIVKSVGRPKVAKGHTVISLVLERDDWASWLDPSVVDPAEVGRLLAFSAPGRFEAHPVGTAVSSNRSNGPQLIEPAGVDELDGVVDPMTGEIIGGETATTGGETRGGPNPA